VSEVEDLGGELEPLAVGVGEAERDERVQQPPGGGAGEPGRLGHVGHGHQCVLGVERPQHGQAALERLHELAVTGDVVGRRSGGAAGRHAGRLTQRCGAVNNVLIPHECTHSEQLGQAVPTVGRPQEDP
jgi:hypothetical protein